MLGVFAPSNDVVSPFVACYAAFIHRGVRSMRKAHNLEEITEVYDLNCHLRFSIVFRLRSLK
jgi:hypothetical protein